ncbi:MAG: C25 family cysteine peptidase [Bacteroidales bacterium]|nr:C25 family cysteine peptidase [Bacteroidales bacterium]
MKKVNYLICVVFVLVGLSSRGQNFTITFNQKNSLTIASEETTYENVTYSFSLNEISGKVVIKRNQSFLELSAPSAVNDAKIGFPSLPTIKRLVEIPMGSEPEVIINSYETEIISLQTFGINLPVLPQQPSVRKDQDPNKLPFYFHNEVYKTKGFIESPIVQVQVSGIARMVQLGRLVISPIQYNPSEHTLKVYKKINFTIQYKKANLSETELIKRKYYSPLFEQQLKSTLLTYQQPMLKDQLTQYPISYLIISHRMFESTLQPFIEWKTRQGYKVTVAYTDVIGTTTTAIKNYITNVYQNGTPQNPSPTFLLLVGDVAQIPTFTGTAGNHATDTYYATMNGPTDKIPDMYVGRMSATSPDQLSNIIAKTLEYEQYTMPDPSYLQYALMIAGVDASYAPTYGNGQINYANQYYTNSSNGITSHTYLYGGGSPIISNSPQAAPAIKQNISNGVGFANYTAHCSSGGWADPSVTTSDVPNFTNAHKYGFMIGNCCQSCRFNDNECFGEAVLRAANKGAIGYIGASNNSYWNEDYYYSVGVKAVSANPSYNAANLGFYDRLFHLFNEPTTEWYVMAAQINYAGNLAVEQNGSNTTYYWEMYHLMGDPSLMPYLGVPSSLFVNYPNSLPLGTPNITIQTEPFAYVGLSLNNVWVDAKYTGNGNSVVLDISSISAPCTLDVVITKQNKQPHKGTIQIIPSTVPFVIYSNHVAIDAGVSSNGNVEYSETVNLSVTLTNVGMQDAYGVQATLSTNNTHVHIVNNTASFGDILASTSSTIGNAFTFTVDTLINDQEIVTFTITANDNQNNTWTSSFNISMFAPVFDVASIQVNDLTGNNNGQLDAGETATLKILTNNIGHAISPQAIGQLSSSSNYITIISASYNLGQLSVNSPIFAEFQITVDQNTPAGTVVPFTYTVNANGYQAIKNFSLPVGLIVEDFESGNFTQFPWDTTNYGNAPWIIYSGTSVFEGDYSARSGIIPNGTWGNNSKSDLKMTINVLSPDSISFYKRVSSEQNYDFLQFFVDNNKLGEWSGEIPWSRSAYYLTAGTHTLLWRYTKDYSLSEGEDAAFLDYIIFPPIELLSNVNNIESDILQIAAFPNPCNTNFNVLLNCVAESQCQLQLYDQMGKLVWSDNEKVSKGKTCISISVENLSEGVYYLHVMTMNQNQTMKIIKIK